MSGELPKGWAWATLGDISHSVRNGIFISRPGIEPNGVPILRISAVRPMRLNVEDVRYTGKSSEEICDAGASLDPGDLLFTRYNGNSNLVGGCAIVPNGVRLVTYPDKLIRARVMKDVVDPKFVMYAFAWEGVRSRVRSYIKTTAGQAGIAGGELKKVALPIPPRAEQSRIVALLDEQLSRLDHASATLTRAERNLGSLATAGLSSLLGEHERVTLQEVLAAGLSNGKSVTTRDGGFPVLRLTALANGRVDLTQRKSGDWDEDQARPYLVSRGDFLISRGNGSISLVGRGSLVESDPDPVAYPDTIIRARPNSEKILSSFLRIIWNSGIVRRQIEQQARTTAGIYKVNQKILSSVSFPLPDLVEQRRFCAQYEDLEWKMSRLSVGVELSQARAESLRRSLLADAFNGRLVPQNSSDESAEAILHRISADRGPAKRRSSGPSLSRVAGRADFSQARLKESAPTAIVPVGFGSQTTLDLEIPE
ncbi:hypothetical protein ABT095_15255 [Kitasatospora sp. NPDC002227]|uniref:restriction endonuclease subunit S n=1 Tax=Kitasatospora sp. NPDC002227 TaxID=3154773 RepID=UPI00332DE1FE